MFKLIVNMYMLILKVNFIITNCVLSQSLPDNVIKDQRLQIDN